MCYNFLFSALIKIKTAKIFFFCTCANALVSFGEFDIYVHDKKDLNILKKIFIDENGKKYPFSSIRSIRDNVSQAQVQSKWCADGNAVRDLG